jgi:hypothetical protein
MTEWEYREKSLLLFCVCVWRGRILSLHTLFSLSRTTMYGGVIDYPAKAMKTKALAGVAKDGAEIMTREEVDKKGEKAFCTNSFKREKVLVKSFLLLLKKKKKKKKIIITKKKRKEQQKK